MPSCSRLCTPPFEMPGSPLTASGYPAERIRIGGAPRYAHLIDRRPAPRTPGSRRRVTVAFAIDEIEDAELLETVYAALRNAGIAVDGLGLPGRTDSNRWRTALRPSDRSSAGAAHAWKPSPRDGGLCDRRDRGCRAARDCVRRPSKCRDRR